MKEDDSKEARVRSTENHPEGISSNIKDTGGNNNRQDKAEYIAGEGGGRVEGEGESNEGGEAASTGKENLS